MECGSVHRRSVPVLATVVAAAKFWRVQWGTGVEFVIGKRRRLLQMHCCCHPSRIYVAATVPSFAPRRSWALVRVGVGAGVVVVAAAVALCLLWVGCHQMDPLAGPARLVWQH